MSESKSTMRKPIFTKVDQLRPGTNGHNLIVKIVTAKTVLQKGRPDGPQLRQMRIAECLVGDETGTIVFTARNDQGQFPNFRTLILTSLQAQLVGLFVGRSIKVAYALCRQKIENQRRIISQRK